MDRFWEVFWVSVYPWLWNGFGAVLILVVGLLVLRYLMPPLRRGLERSRMEPSLVSFLTNSVRGILLVVIGIGILQRLGVPTGSLLTVLAAAGLAVALSLQNTLANFTAGLVLLSFRLLRVGDLIETGTIRGRVAEIFPFHVVLITSDNQVVTVPNTQLMAASFRNASTLPTLRVQWTLAVCASDDLKSLREKLRERLLADPRIHREPPPRVLVQEWSDDKRLLAIQAWTSAAEAPLVQEELLEPLGLALETLRQQGTTTTITAS